MPTIKSWFKICCLLFAWPVNTVIAQDNTCEIVIAGVVIDEHNLEPISDVYITSSQFSDKVFFTDAKGRFSITATCMDSVTLVFNHIGCETVIKKQFVSNSDIHLDVLMEHHLEELSQFVVTGEKHHEVLQQRDQLSQEDIVINAGKTLGEQLSQINGVRQLTTGATVAKPVIQGQHSNRLLLINNGIRQEGQQWGSDHAPSLNAFDKSSITVLKGASSVRYGANAIGGVVLMESDAMPANPGVEGSVGSALHTNGKLYQGYVLLGQQFKKLKGVGYQVSATYKANGNLKTPDYYLQNTAANESFVGGAITYVGDHYEVVLRNNVMNNKTGVFEGAHIGNLSDLQAAFNREQPIGENGFSYEINRPYQLVYHEVNQLTQKFKTHQLGVFDINLSRQFNVRDEFDKIERGGSSNAELHLELTTHQGELLWHHPEKLGLHGVIGVSAMSQENTYLGRDFIPNYTHKNLGVFWIEHKEIKRWRFESGLRLENDFLQVYRLENNVVQTPQYNYKQLSYNLGASYKINNYIAGHLRIANAWRPPHVSELYSNGVHHGAAAIEKGNTTLKKEETLGVYGGLDVDYKKWQIELEGYVNSSDNYIYLKAADEPELTIRGAFPSYTYQQTKAQIKGLESTVQYRWNKKQQTVLAVALINAQDVANNVGLVGVPSNQIDVKHNVLGNSVKDKLDWKANVGVSYVAKQNNVDANQDFVAVPNAYQLVNIGFQFKWKSKQTLSIQVSNLFNAKYRNYMNRLRYYSDEVGRNIQLTYQLKF
jgi:iron complex outermembrane receptor protein